MDSHFSQSSQNPIFVSLGMVILDEIRFTDGKVLHDVAGGSGLYSTLGARMTDTAAAHPKKVGCCVLAGADFPDSMEQAIKSWGIALTVIRDPSRLSTRGLLTYSGDSFKERTFEYTTTPLQPTPADLSGSPLLRSQAFHFLAPPELMATFAADLAALQVSAGVAAQPLMVWEPAPASCHPAKRDAHLETAKCVDIYSPNHIELLATFGSGVGPPAEEFHRKTIEEQALRILDSGVGRDGDGAVVIRCGEHGCVVVSRSYPARWFPAYHRGSESSRVVDATGAGNAFLGAFAVTFAIASDLTEAAIAGSVAASFAIEQVGLPDRSSRHGKEMWNGEEFSARVDRFRTMLETTVNGWSAGEE
ncbi:Ribokinase-like protein [Achaetomium macrosporum]|uniref:Ribokinase-like protein n=1 Tax=Achaetomium macrosporum TaxID=79813 RepID=A0AAN7H8U4_9PEZI|nr:Ribokinase-like protein [Achaetomium macrosporum]